MENEEGVKPISEHLEDVRSLVLRLLFVWGGSALLVSFYLSPCIDFLLAPYGKTLSSNFLLLSPLEGWWMGCFVALLGGALLALPLLLFFITRYVLPALYPDEGKKLVFLGGFFTLFSTLGFFLGHFLFAPLFIQTLQTSVIVPGIPAYAVREALHFVVSIDLGVMVLLNLMGGLSLAVCKGWISPTTLASWRKPYILAAFIVGAILTPPDILSQVLMATALIAGFELTLLLGKMFKK